MTDIGDMIERGSDGPEWAQHRHDAAWREITDQAKALAENAALRAEVERATKSAATASALFDEAKRLQGENFALRAEVERLRVEVAMYRSALANALEIALPMPQPPEEE